MTKQEYFSGKLNAETLQGPSLTVSGQAQSVYDLYRKMVLGNLDAANYVRGVSYDENPDIDSPDPTNSFGLTYEEVHEQSSRARQIYESEKEKAKAKTVNEPDPDPGATKQKPSDEPQS